LIVLHVFFAGAIILQLLQVGSLTHPSSTKLLNLRRLPLLQQRRQHRLLLLQLQLLLLLSHEQQTLKSSKSVFQHDAALLLCPQQY
jgi:hypothetical protein